VFYFFMFLFSMVLGGSNGVGLVCSKGVFVPGIFGSVLDGSICFYGGIHTTNLFSFYGGIHTTGLLFLVLDLSLRWFGCEVVGGDGEWNWWSGVVVSWWCTEVPVVVVVSNVGMVYENR
jgi:hypothetical protein